MLCCGQWKSPETQSWYEKSDTYSSGTSCLESHLLPTGNTCSREGQIFPPSFLMDTYGAFPLHGTARYGTVHFWGVFHWVLYLVPDTFLVPLRSRFQASRTVTKTWRVNSADHWLAGENRHYCVTELAIRDPPLQPDPLDLNQHSQRRIGRNFCLNKRTFLHQPQNSSVVVCWGRTDVLLVDGRGADPARAWWHDAEGKSLMYITLLLNLLYFQIMFSVYIFTSVSVFCFN